MPRGPQGRLLPVYLEHDLYRQLDQKAKDNDREVTQQARHIIRLALQDDLPIAVTDYHELTVESDPREPADQPPVDEEPASRGAAS